MFEDAKKMITDLKIASKKNYYDGARELLVDAINMNFETVIILGFKDSTISVKSSKWEKTITLVGALEYAKIIF
jgi:hypothetical protein